MNKTTPKNDLKNNFKTQIIQNLDAHDQALISADNCSTLVALNMSKAYSEGIVALPKLNDSKHINKACEHFVEVALELEFKKLSANKKSCLRKSIVVAVGLVKSKALTKVKNKSVSDDNKLWIDGDYLKSKNNLKNLNKSGNAQVPLNFNELTKMSKNVLNFKDSPTKQTPLELALSKVNDQIDNIARLEPINENDQDDQGLINITDKEKNAINFTFNKLKKIKEELNAQEPNKDVINFQ
tara:strand:- start:124 stop:843 length:720 start_codon:yes stop_codon:yes gene_type:complete